MDTIYCPRCHCELKVQPYWKVRMASCFQCEGNWYFGDTLAQLLSLQKNRDLLDFSRDLFFQKESELDCPDCHCHMVAKTFKKSNGLTIDQCSHCHGVWLDKGELSKTKEFVKQYVAVRTRKEKEKEKVKTLGKLHPLRIYPVPQEKQQKLPRVINKIPSLELVEEQDEKLELVEERDEKAEEQELEEGTAAAEVTMGIWAFTVLTGMPMEAYNPPRRSFPGVVVTLIALNFLIHLLVQTMSLSQLTNFFGNYGAVPAKIFDGTNLFSLITHVFLHGGWIHLIGNMYFLWVFGDNVEDKLGHIPFIFFYLVCGIFAALCQLFMMKKMGSLNTPLIGASGAVAGVMGAYLYLFPKAALYQTIIIPYPIKIPVTIYLGFWVLIQFIGNASNVQNIAWWAHLGGFFLGFIFAFFWRQVRKICSISSQENLI